MFKGFIIYYNRVNFQEIIISHKYLQLIMVQTEKIFKLFIIALKVKIYFFPVF